MKKRMAFLLIFCALFCGAGTLSAQLAVSLKISQNNYLPYEPVFARVSIRNFSAHSVIFGGSKQLAGTLTFEIRPDDSASKRPVKLLKNDGLPPLTGSIIPPGGQEEYTFNLCDYYELRKEGTYSVRAVVKHNLFHQEYVSEPVTICLVKGFVIWSTPVGVPDLNTKDPDPSKKVDQRTYSIISYNTGRTQVYNLRVEDEKTIYANRRIAFDLGGELRPKCMIDFMSRLHVLLAASNSVFAYYVFTVDGRLDKRQILVKEFGNPILTSDPKTGFVTVLGGREAKPDTDYELIKDLPFLGMKPGGNVGTAPRREGKDGHELDAIKE